MFALVLPGQLVSATEAQEFEGSLRTAARRDIAFEVMD